MKWERVGELSSWMNSVYMLLLCLCVVVFGSR